MTPPPSDAAPYSEATFYAEATRFLNGDTKGIVTAPELSRLMARIATQETATDRARIAELASLLQSSSMLLGQAADGFEGLECRHGSRFAHRAPCMTLERGADTVGTNKMREMASRIDKALAPAAEPESLRAKGG